MKKFYNGMLTLVFKNTLCTYKDHGILIWLLESCLDIKINKLILKDKELYKDNLYRSDYLLLFFVKKCKLFHISINCKLTKGSELCYTK